MKPRIQTPPEADGATSDLQRLGRIAALAAHDLNNLLQASLLQLEFALADSGDRSSLIEQVVDQLSLARKMTDQMLSLSGAGGDGQQVLDLVAAIRRNEDSLRRMMPPNIVIASAFPDRMHCVRANPGRLRRSVLNIVLNAIDAIGVGGGTIRFVVEGTADEVRLVVEDDGCGMDESTLELVKSPFYTTKEHGRGLGLTSVRDNVLADGGRFLLESAPGVGTRVGMCFPAVTDAPPRAVAERRPFRRAGRSRRILVVEDEPFLRHAMASAVWKMGYEPFIASSGEDAVSLLLSVGGFWGALVDYSLPGPMDGVALIGEIRNRAADVKIVLMSGFDLRSELENVPEAALDGVLRKPFSASDLQDEFDRLDRSG